MKRITTRNTFAALSVVIAMTSGAAQAASADNSQIGHFAPAGQTAFEAQATGFSNTQVGHFALQASRPATNSTADSGGVIGGSEYLPR